MLHGEAASCQELHTEHLVGALRQHGIGPRSRCLGNAPKLSGHRNLARLYLANDGLVLGQGPLKCELSNQTANQRREDYDQGARADRNDAAPALLTPASEDPGEAEKTKSQQSQCQNHQEELRKGGWSRRKRGKCQEPKSGDDQRKSIETWHRVSIVLIHRQGIFMNLTVRAGSKGCNRQHERSLFLVQTELIDGDVLSVGLQEFLR